MKELVPVLEETLFSDQIKDISVDYLELGVDLLFKNEVIKEIPIVKTLVAAGKVGQLVWERNLINQLISFINGYNTNNFDPKKIEKKIKELKNNPKKLNQELSRIIFILNKNIENKKAYYLGKMYCAYLSGIIKWDKFCEMSEVNDRLFVSDIPTLFAVYKNELNEKDSFNYNIDRLTSIGLIKVNIVVFEDDEKASSPSEKEEDNFIEITTLGQIFCEIIKDK